MKTDNLTEIYKTLDIESLLSELDPINEGKYYLLTCPSCHKKEAFIYHNNPRHIECSRKNNCGETTTIWDYIQDRERLENSETIRFLARYSEHTLEEMTPQQAEQLTKQKKRSSLLSTALEYFQEKLLNDIRAQVTLSYLQEERGYTLNEIKNMGLGFYPPQEEFKEFMTSKKFEITELKRLGLLSNYYGNTHKIVIPYYDDLGRLKGFVFRWTNGKSDKKYHVMSEVERDIFFNFYQAKKGRNLIVTEGYFDPLICRERGITNVVGNGGAEIPQKMIINAIQSGIKTFILALDNDPSGLKATNNSIKRITQNGARAYVVPLPEGIKDPDDLIREQGIEEFKKLLLKPLSSSEWFVIQLSKKYDLKTTFGRDQALEEALAYEETLTDYRDIHDLINKLTELSNLPLEYLQQKFSDWKEKKARERERKGYEELLKHSDRLLQDGNITELKAYLNDKQTELKAIVGKEIVPYTMDDFHKDLENESQGLKTGYSELDKYVTIPSQDLTIVCGRTSHGKTTVLINLCLNNIDMYQDKSFLFLTYEETKKDLQVKTIINKSGVVLQKGKENLNFILLKNYLKGRNTSNLKITEGYREVSQLIESERLLFNDDKPYIEELSEMLAKFVTRYNVGAVYIDYLQKIKTRASYPTRQLELQAIVQKLELIAHELSIPIILGAQLGRKEGGRKSILTDSNIREAGDIEQTANLILGLWNYKKAKEKGEGNEEINELPEHLTKLDIEILKNRNGGGVGKSVPLVFNAPIMKLTE